MDVLRRIWELIRDITPANDAKLACLLSLLAGELRGQKVLVFTYFKDTARYLYRELRRIRDPGEGNRRDPSIT